MKKPTNSKKIQDNTTKHSPSKETLPSESSDNTSKPDVKKEANESHSTEVQSPPNLLKRLYTNPFFTGLTPTQMNFVARYWRIRKFDANFTLFKENDSPDYIYYVIEGSLSVIKSSSDGKNSVVVAELGQDHLLGELAIIENCPRSATVVTKTNSTLLLMHQRHFNLLVKGHPDIGVVLFRNIAKMISKQLRDTTGKFANTKHSG